MGRHSLTPIKFMHAYLPSSDSPAGEIRTGCHWSRGRIRTLTIGSCLFGCLLISSWDSSIWSQDASPDTSANSPTPANPDQSPFDFEQARQALQTACAECHGGGADEGGFALESLLDNHETLRSRFESWQTVRQRINERSMPPADAEPMNDADREATVAWIQQASVAALTKAPPQAGPPLLRRLSRHEYANTMRDLLNIHFDAGQGLPEDTAGGEGFTNAAETLIISPIHAEKYLEAATTALDYAARNEATRQRLLVKLPENAESEKAAAQENLRRLADRAFRRPVTAEEVTRYLAVYQAARDDGLSFEEAVFYAMRGILISPSFLFIAESNPMTPDQAEPLSDHELATRLSYFLWASMPDDELRQVADQGKLNNDEELRKQALRMLDKRGTHLQDSMEHFVGGWLGTADLGRSKKVDRQRHGWIRDPHVAALRNQPIYYMESVLQSNESLLTLIDANWTFLNNELVGVYRLDRKKIKGDFVQRLKRVELAEDYRSRGGLLGMGGVYVVSSYPGRSSPVLRGAWVLEKMLGIELPPPPPDVPELQESGEEVEAKTLRERLEQHRADASCASCHNRIDPVGFALENFDEIGRWREKDGKLPIDAVAELPNGVKLDGVHGLKQYLLQEKEAFVRNLTRKMLGYALGRSLRPSDLSTVERVVRRLQENDYRAHELVLGIIESEPFRKKRITQPETESE